MKSIRFVFLVVLLGIEALSVWAIPFDPSVRYSQRIIESCVPNYRCNKKPAKDVGFDYVSGLVNKAVIEAAWQYHDSAFAQDWYEQVRDFGNRYYDAGFSATQSDLDKLNAVKLYFGLSDAALSGYFVRDSVTAMHCDFACRKAVVALEHYNHTFVISDSVSQAFCGTPFFSGGWWHKAIYENEMWCDGQYMGPALLAQLLARRYKIQGMDTLSCWHLVTRQFDMTWHQLWNPQDEMLYHAFSASPEKDPLWADSVSGVSGEYWGRAVGWYMVALVDVLEAMSYARPDLHPSLRADFFRLRAYLEQLAAGVLARQDSETGLWCQLMRYPNGYIPEGCDRPNYIESSCSALFIAAYLKAARLGFIHREMYVAVASRAYRSFVERFVVENAGDGNPLAIIDCCASAGLSDKRKGDAAYYLCGSDVTRITTYTEGKALGAFILAALEYERLE